MEKAQAWAQKGIIALLAVFVACCCTFLAGCAENAEDAVRKVVTEEFDEVKNASAEEIEQLSAASSEFASLSAYGITAADAYDAIFSEFDYKIDSIKVDGDKATVGVVFTTKDLTTFQSALTTAAQNAVADGSLAEAEDMNAAIGQLVIDTIKDLPTTETKVIEFDVVKVAGNWEMASDSGEILQEALFPSSIMNSL
ncbi:hypothetical protein [Anaerotardibacter muris]|uniref:hypothetical protein n=1 Tax=Anaerotardibacter muris TaxID=2941505 RepID=UPI00203C9642|nr:hypothetical protein [Anaerotardibacter muris]